MTLARELLFLLKTHLFLLKASLCLISISLPEIVRCCVMVVLWFNLLSHHSHWVNCCSQTALELLANSLNEMLSKEECVSPANNSPMFTCTVFHSWKIISWRTHPLPYGDMVTFTKFSMSKQYPGLGQNKWHNAYG